MEVWIVFAGNGKILGIFDKSELCFRSIDVTYSTAGVLLEPNVDYDAGVGTVKVPKFKRGETVIPEEVLRVERHAVNSTWDHL